MSYFLYQKPPKYILYMTLTLEDKERIKQLRAKGLSYDKIRGGTGFSRETIRKVLGLVKQGEGGTSSPAIAHVVDQPSEPKPYTPSPKKRDKLQEFIDSPYPSRKAFYYWQQWQWLQWQKRNYQEEQFERLEREIKELKEEKRQEEWRRKIEIEREKKLKELHKKIMEYKAKYYSQRECGETK